jgi:hypothetical protein
MSALLQVSFKPSLEDRIDQEAVPKCRFCGCTEFAPCPIPVTTDRDGTVRLARHEAEVDAVLPCAWYIDGVCNAPCCMEKLLAEWKKDGPSEPRVLLFDAAGHRISRDGERIA